MNLFDSTFVAVASVSWRTSVLIGCFLAVRPLLRKQIPARLIFWAWIAIGVRLLLPFSVPARFSPFNLLPRPMAPLGVARPVPASVPLNHSSPTGLTSLFSRLPAAPLLRQPADATRAAPWSPLRWAALVWILGVAVQLIVRIQAYQSFVRRLRFEEANRPLVPSQRMARIGVPVSFTNLVPTPAVQGLLRPRLLLPPGLLDCLSPQEIRLVIAHELGHIERRDLWAQVLLQLARLLHWFNPLVWIAVRAGRHDCELACDEHVLRQVGPAKSAAYGETLLKIISLTPGIRAVPLGVGIVESKTQIKRRIKMIIAYQPPTRLRTTLACVVLAALLLLTLTRESRAETTASPSLANPTPLAPPTLSAPAPAASSAGAPANLVVPTGWFKNGIPTRLAFYDVGLDAAQSHDGSPAVVVRSRDAVKQGFAGMMQMCQAERYAGKRLRYSGWIKSDRADDGGAHLWFRVDGSDSAKMLAFDNMDDRPIKGTTDWQHYSIVLDVPNGSEALAYGVFVSGSGAAWFSGITLEEVGSEVLTTNPPIDTKPRLPKEPVNLSFQ